MQTDTIHSFGYDSKSEENWEKIYQIIRPLAQHLTRTASIPSWRGQESDIAEDITQETMRRLIDRVRKGEQKVNSPIDSLEHMARVIAWNYYRDLRRRDHRIVHLPFDNESSEEQLFYYADAINSPVEIAQVADPAVIVTEEDSKEELFQVLAQEIVHFPLKQRTALFMDLASHMLFDTTPTALENAFLTVGVSLRDYQQPIPNTPEDRNRHASLLAHAYKRIANMQLISTDTDELVDSWRVPEQRDMKSNVSWRTTTEEDSAKASTLKNAFQEIDTNSALVDSIQQLPEPYKAVVHLHVLCKWTYTQIANSLNRSKGTVKSQVYRGMAMLYQCKKKQKETNLLNGWHKTCIQHGEDLNLLADRAGQLPEPYQTAIRLHYLQKLTYPEMAEQLGLPKGTIKSQVSRGMKMLSQ